ncbi:MAG TPA: hypothetical protein VLY23_15460 [Candidatus Acidoferrum sp.]|nr:hypothetical protein [Candidatus Acidoferrum sp.]
MRVEFRRQARITPCVICLVLLFAGAARAQQHYKNFRVAVYIPVGVVKQMEDPKWLANSWETISRQVDVDKVYIETYRSRQIAGDNLIEQVKKFFSEHGVQVAGGIALTGNEARQFESFCYTDPGDRAYVKHVAELTARHFDEIILDDFFFVDTKRDSDIAAKGSKSWTQFRLDLMDDAARDLVIGPIKAVNPKAKVIIKFPNWYEHFQGSGFDLDKEPRLFDGIYTGTETRDPVITDQNLQQYESYQIFRYFGNIKPGGNGGGWVDTFSIRYVDRYAEQLWDTVFAKAPEITLFYWGGLLQPVTPGDRDAWKDLHTSFDYDQMLAYRDPGRSTAPTMARVAGYSLKQVDPIVGQLGRPIGIESYKPYQSVGEDFLHNFLGMVGIPIDLQPSFPVNADVVLLTESAKFDPEIASKIKAQLQAGKNVVITSGLLRALEGKGIEDIVELRSTGRRVAVRDYVGAFGAGGGNALGEKQNPEVLIPEIRFLTNDAWPLVRGIASGNGSPLLIMDRYSKGILFVLTIPDNFTDLYNLPPEVLSAIKSYILGDFPVRLDAPSKVSLFAYDNGTFIVESFLDTRAEVSAAVTGDIWELKNVVTGEVVHGERAPAGRQFGPQRTTFRISLEPHSYAAFAEIR